MPTDTSDAAVSQALIECDPSDRICDLVNALLKERNVLATSNKAWQSVVKRATDTLKALRRENAR